MAHFMLKYSKYDSILYQYTLDIKKSINSNVFLQPLINNLIDLINNRYIHNKNIIKVLLFALVCDASAKSFILCIKSHIGFNSCNK